MSQLLDRFNRTHDYLRIAVTDRCNLKCVYCMPSEGIKFMEEIKLLTSEEIVEIVSIGAELGIKKIRLTGGEPLVREELESLINELSNIAGIEDISLTTNGYFLANKAEALKKAGLSRINISIDSLRSDRFKEITRGGNLDRVLAGLDAAHNAGLNPIKINTVLLKDFNDDEIGDFINLTINQPFHVRFIEYMPIGHADSSWKKKYLSLDHVKLWAKELGYELEQSEVLKGNGPAEYFRVKGAKGSFGLIHPVSNNFCANCNRLRITADGYLKGCLYWDEELNLKKHIGDKKKIVEIFQKALLDKPENHEMANMLNNELQSHNPTKRRMSQIGG